MKLRVAELFAGVGGFRLGFDNEIFETVWANQWEPGTDRRQFAWRCYESHFGDGSCVNRDINEVLDDYENGLIEIPDVDIVVGGFPCQDYSVAKPLPDAAGIEGEKGVLWWDMYRFARLKRPKYCLFENVDRLLKSPAPRRGRDFAIMLACLCNLGYDVEWAVINSADYGFPQRRKRVYILAKRSELTFGTTLARAFPYDGTTNCTAFDIPEDPYEITTSFNLDGNASPFLSRGKVSKHHVITYEPDAVVYDGERMTLGDVLAPADEVPERFWIPEEQLKRWEYLKGAKKEPRIAKNGHEYMYTEGAITYPDMLDRPSRTILTSEGGTAPSRMKHVVKQGDRLRRLMPDELDKLQMFPMGWTDTGMTESQRAFCMGNALVVGVVRRIADEIAEEAQWVIRS